MRFLFGTPDLLSNKGEFAVPSNTSLIKFNLPLTEGTFSTILRCLVRQLF